MVNMSAEDLQTKYDGHLNSEMVGPLHNLIAKVRLVVDRNIMDAALELPRLPHMLVLQMYLCFSMLICLKSQRSVNYVVSNAALCMLFPSRVACKLDPAI